MAEMRRNRQKAAVLAVLLPVGLYFWLPPVFRLLKGSGASMPETAIAAPQGTGSPAEAVAALPSVPSANAPEGKSEGTWQQIVQLLKSDPLFRSAEPASVRSDAFQIDHDQFSPPVDDIFEPEPKSTGDQNRVTAGPPSIDGLVLKSTIIGVKQRAAFINGRLYFEGNTIPWKGTSYVLTAIRPRSVELTYQQTTLELKIKDETPSQEIELRPLNADASQQ
jgi:hypothetical protein